VVVVLPYTRVSLELPSDLEDSDSRLTGSARADAWSSPYAGGPEREGRGGSSKVTLCFPETDPCGSIVFRLSSLSFSFLTSSTKALGVLGRGTPSVAPSCPSGRGSSPDRRLRADSFARDSFFCAGSISIVGAVVMISGAAVSTCVSRGSFSSFVEECGHQERLTSRCRGWYLGSSL
jgi:hypothetical protein